MPFLNSVGLLRLDSERSGRGVVDGVAAMTPIRLTGKNQRRVRARRSQPRVAGRPFDNEQAECHELEADRVGTVVGDTIALITAKKIVQPTERPSRFGILRQKRPQSVAHLSGPGRRRQALAADIADDERDTIIVEREDIVEIATDIRLV